MRVLSIFFLFLISFSINAQKVKILERGTNFPIENVTIYNDLNSTVVYSDKKGIADLSSFKAPNIILATNNASNGNDS